MADLPLALRRTRRSTGPPRSLTRIAPDQPSIPPSCLSSKALSSHTPSRGTRSRRKVRFSDPGPAPDNDDLIPSSPGTTGLTPLVRRTALMQNPARRRSSTPAKSESGNGLGSTSTLQETSPSSALSRSALSHVIHGRIHRRTRRNGMSKESTLINAEIGSETRLVRDNIAELKAEIAARDGEIEQLRSSSKAALATDAVRVAGLERQIDDLQRALAEHSSALLPSTPITASIDWTAAARGPYSDEAGDNMAVDSDPLLPDEDDDEMFGDSTIAELTCSTPSRRTSFRQSMLTPPSTSPPARSSPPCTIVNANVAALFLTRPVLPSTGRPVLEDELVSLRDEITKLVATVEALERSRSRMRAQMAAALSPADSKESIARAEDEDLEKFLDAILHNLSSKSIELANLTNSLATLGFPGSDAASTVLSITTSFRTARLELEYLTPGEITLPLTCAGAAILDLLLTRLRDLSHKNHENEETVDEYHALETSLRQQLGARVEAMDGMAREVRNLQADILQKEGRTRELEVGMQRLRGAVTSYVRDVAELEELVRRIESDLHAAREELLAHKASAEVSIAEMAKDVATKSSSIAGLQSKLCAANNQLQQVETELTTLQTQLNSTKASRKADTLAATKAHGQVLALRDGRVTELRLEIERVNAALRAAHQTICKLRVDNASLKEQLVAEKARAAIITTNLPMTPRRSVKSTRGSGRMSAKAETVTKEGSVGKLPGKDMGEAVASPTKARKRQRYDSGLGFLDEEDGSQGDDGM